MAVGRPQVADAEERWLSVNGIRTRYLFSACSSGSPGLPVLLVHGLLGFSYSWRQNIAALSSFADIYAPDLPGVGYSARSPGLDCSLSGLAEFLLAFAADLQLRNFDVVATSHGGALAMMAAAADAQAAGLSHRRIRRLVLVAPVNPWSAGRPWLTRMAAGRLGALCLRASYPLLARANGILLRRLYGDPARMQAEAARNYACAASLPGTARHLSRIMKCWHRDIRLLAESLPAIRAIPTLLIWGTRDRAVLPSSAAPLARSFDHVQVTMIPAAGHLPYEETPGAFNDAVKHFLTAPTIA